MEWRNSTKQQGYVMNLEQLIADCNFQWYHTVLFFTGVGFIFATLPTYFWGNV